eukprot:TRINITY_DN108663_c0_g1_i1.p1 TRINITY_DN108663_c0_g1~~TRINITY_DN108663_c0_g1_i1.p1  ORF type:complete len:122 (-),score=13.84 TRINITY_DN108663_c0_g1_i1:88-453(-)
MSMTKQEIETVIAKMEKEMKTGVDMDYDAEPCYTLSVDNNIDTTGPNVAPHPDVIAARARIAQLPNVLLVAGTENVFLCGAGAAEVPSLTVINAVVTRNNTVQLTFHKPANGCTQPTPVQL